MLPLLLGSALCCSLSILVLFSELDVLYLTFIVLAAFRSVMYSLAVAFLTLTLVVCGYRRCCCVSSCVFWRSPSSLSPQSFVVFAVVVVVVSSCVFWL